MLGKEKFECIEEAIETYLSGYRLYLSDFEYSSIYEKLIDRNQFVWEDMEVNEIYYEVEAFFEGFMLSKKLLKNVEKKRSH